MNMKTPFKMPPVAKRDGDYVGEDGRLFCGVCHEPREAFFSVPGEETVQMKHPALCACERAKQTAAEEEKRLHDHIDKVTHLWQRCFLDGIAKMARFEDAAVPKRIVELCRGYVSHWDAAVSDGMGLLFWGDVGTGKSYMASAIAKELIEREYSVEMRDMSYYLNCRYEERVSRIEAVSLPDLLILDDLGVERDTGFGLETVFSVIDRRYSTVQSHAISVQHHPCTVNLF